MWDQKGSKLRLGKKCKSCRDQEPTGARHINPEETLAITDRLLSDGVQRLLCFRICANLIDALLPNSNVLFTFRSALHEQRVSELSLGFCGGYDFNFAYHQGRQHHAAHSRISGNLSAFSEPCSTTECKKIGETVRRKSRLNRIQHTIYFGFT